jgi:hypothetical protein
MCSGSAKHEMLRVVFEVCHDAKIKNGTKQWNSKTREVSKKQNQPTNLELGSWF